MVNFPPARASGPALDRIFAALSDPTRRRILTRLGSGPTTVSELAAPFRMSLPAVSKHIRALERAGLIAREVDGRVHRCRLNSAGLIGAATWIDQHRLFWTQQFDQLERYVGRPEVRRPRPPRKERKSS
jgi:DNA-binding transcriptional ArsR family regulator